MAAKKATPNTDELEVPIRQRSGRPLLVFSIVLLVCATASASFFYREAQKLKSATPQSVAEQISTLNAKLGELIELPQGELPVIATVADPLALAQNRFFARAKEGDLFFYYPASRRAFLYDPEAHRVLNTATIGINQ